MDGTTAGSVESDVDSSEPGTPTNETDAVESPGRDAAAPISPEAVVLAAARLGDRPDTGRPGRRSVGRGRAQDPALPPREDARPGARRHRRRGPGGGPRDARRGAPDARRVAGLRRRVRARREAALSRRAARHRGSARRRPGPRRPHRDPRGLRRAAQRPPARRPRAAPRRRGVPSGRRAASISSRCSNRSASPRSSATTTTFAETPGLAALAVPPHAPGSCATGCRRRSGTPTRPSGHSTVTSGRPISPRSTSSGSRPSGCATRSSSSGSRSSRGRRRSSGRSSRSRTTSGPARPPRRRAAAPGSSRRPPTLTDAQAKAIAKFVGHLDQGVERLRETFGPRGDPSSPRATGAAWAGRSRGSERRTCTEEP